MASYLHRAPQPSRPGPCTTTIPLPMADAARPAHPAGGPLVTILSLGLAVMPLRAHAEPAPPTAAAPAEPTEAGAPEGTPTEPDAAAPETEGDGGGEGPAAEADPEAETETGAGADPEAELAADEASDDASAKAEPADAATKPDQAAAPGALGPTAAPLRPMQTAAWWTMFGAFAMGTTAGVLAGLAERQEDRATRLSTLFDAETGAQPLYADRKAEYEQYLRRGEGYATAALGVGIVAGAATIAAITLFAIDARRQRGDATRKAKEPPRRASLRVRGGGMEVRF